MDRSAYLTAPIPTMRATAARSSAASARILAATAALAAARHGLVEQVHQLDRLARPGSEHLVVGAQDAPEPDVDRGRSRRVSQPASLRHGEAHRQVLGLRRSHHVEGQVRLQPTETVPQGGQVRGGVAVAAVGLADDQRQRVAVAVGVPGRKDTQGAIAFDQQAGGIELGHHAGSRSL